jgi:cardiolipin synthase A/B
MALEARIFLKNTCSDWRTRWYELHKIHHRSHIRVVCIDGRIGYTGGFGLDDKWLGDGRHEGQWRDSTVRFEGPAVHQLQATFAAGWCEAAEELLTAEVIFPPEPPEREGGMCAGTLHAAPTVGSTPAERYFALAIGASRKSLYITNSYFVPTDELCTMLQDAARRGVDVRILTPGPNSDVISTYYAGRSMVEGLLRAGVRFYEYEPSMLHAKTVVVDGVWSAVGTVNFDNRSLAFNDEVMLFVYDREFGAHMEKVYHEDLAYSKEVTLEMHLARPLKGKLLERFYSLFYRLL